MLENYHAETNDYIQDRYDMKNIKYQEQFASKNHHLVSTKAMPSIFTANGLNQEQEQMSLIEKYIKSYNKARILVPCLTPR